MQHGEGIVSTGVSLNAQTSIVLSALWLSIDFITLPFICNSQSLNISLQVTGR